jgi:hypothetical protein
MKRSKTLIHEQYGWADDHRTTVLTHPVSLDLVTLESSD